MRILLLLAALIAAPAGAQVAPRLIADLSQSRIDIVYTFAGAELLVFGAIQYPDGKMPDERPDMAIIVRGPPESITVRRKERVLGVWVNTDAVRFETAPAFFHAASTRPILDIVDERTAAIFELSPEYLQLSPGGGADAATVTAFEAGLLGTWGSEDLYGADPVGVDIVEDVLYRARIDLPSKVPVGTYSVEIHLIQDGDVVSSATQTISVEKSGFERAVFMMAQNKGAAYGVFAVSIALLLGWLAGVILKR
ncbi:TIGR02186 family protein [Pacificimonas sp. WHA3]|uniref:TIGR02186 family protein n=1 Tax=Pacificimonas pallii TaxID=2827236 RepID=A0ABS6SC02_9SPHN|nr:TIGR02186 family protein [Pacificimonas pallii]MBV7255618.1 TIGR02186 family protein [Pacificimonas pallii]